MRLDRLGSVWGALPLLRAGLLRPQPGMRILMYHSVSDDSEAGVPPYYRLTTSPARFRQQMLALRRSGSTVIGLPEALRRLASGSFDGRRLVVLTFDDGLRDFATHAWPVLQELGFPASVFLPTAFIGSTRRSFKGRACLTWREVRDLHAQGVHVGAHTVTHPMLHGLGWPEIRRELGQARSEIEQQVRAPIETFCYPYAFPQEDEAFITRFRVELLEQGYAGAVTTMIGPIGPGSDALSLKRLPVNDGDDPLLLECKLRGAYDWVGRLQTIVRSAKGRRRHSRAA